MTEKIKAMDLDTGLPQYEIDEIGRLRAELSALIELIAALPKHRSYSLAITKLDEARHWLGDRRHRLASE